MARISRRQIAAYAVSQLEAGASHTKLGKMLAAALIDNKHAHEIDYLIADIKQILEARGHQAHVRVTTARSIDDSLRQLIAGHVKTATGVKAVVLEEKIEPSVLGGVHIETAAKSWDETLARKLSVIKGGISG